MAYATVADLEARWRVMSPSEYRQAEVLLDDAAVEIDIHCKPSDKVEWLEKAKAVSCAMVKRAMSEDGDLFSSDAGMMMRPQSPAGDVRIQKREINALKLAAGRSIIGFAGL